MDIRSILLFVGCVAFAALIEWLIWDQLRPFEKTAVFVAAAAATIFALVWVVRASRGTL